MAQLAEAAQPGSNRSATAPVFHPDRTAAEPETEPETEPGRRSNRNRNRSALAYARMAV